MWSSNEGEARKMNVYDFDGTIYKGDSSVDFTRFCIGKNKKCWRAIPKIIAAGIRYALKRISTKEFKEVFFSYLKHLDPTDVDSLISEFWKTHRCKIAAWYDKKRNADDLVISASPKFLLEPIIRSLGINNLIATEMDKNSGVIEGENCKGAEKVRRLKEEYVSAQIDCFYSDSILDKPLAEMANKAYFVTGEQIEPWSKKGAKEETGLTGFALKHKDIVLYGIFGVLTTLINIVAYIVCFNVFSISNVPSTIIAWIIAVIFAFITNKLWVFDSKNFDRRTLAHEIPTFFGARIATGVLDVLIMYLTVDVMNWNSTIWKLISNVIVIVLNYVASKLIIFKK